MAFPTDPTIRFTPATLSGRIHDLAFAAFGLAMLPAILLFGYAFRLSRQWRDLVPWTWLYAVLVLPTFIFKGGFFYLFLVSTLVWDEWVALRLWRNGRQ